MKVLGVVCATALFVALSAAVPALAQDEHQQEQAKPEKQAQQAKPAQHEQQAKPAKQEQAAKPQQRQEQAKSEKQQQNNSAKQQHQQQVKGQQQARANNQKQQQAKSQKQEQQTRQVKQEDRGRTAGQQHVQRTSAEEQRQRAVPALRLSPRGNARIPDDRFRSNFGRGHEFRIGSPRVVDGYSRFQYGGYWFGFVQPWPVNWYYTDDVYVDYINGQYYLCNPSYPGAQIAISVVL